MTASVAASVVGRMPVFSAAKRSATASLLRYLQEVDRLGWGILADRVAVAAAEDVGRQARTAFDRREGEPAERIADALARLALGDLRAGCPLAHELHGGLAVAHVGCLALVIRGCQETVLEGLEADEALELVAGLDEGRAVPVARGDGLLMAAWPPMRSAR